jgi:putative DNA primase/helicase
LQKILELARSASSTGAIVAKGTTHGHAMTFNIRSMFCLAAVGGAVRHEADKSRVAMVQLRSPSDVGAEVRREHWKRWKLKLRGVTPEVGRELFSRTLHWLRSGKLAETIAVFTTQASIILGNARAGDQYGTLYAGAWTLMSDEVPGEDEAREILLTGALGAYVEDQAPEGIRVIDVIMQQRERIDTPDGPKMLTVGELVEACRQPGRVTEAVATTALRQIGIRVEPEHDGWALWVAHKSEWMSRVLQNTPYSANIAGAFRTLRGVRAKGTVNFGGFYSRATVVPLVAVDSWWHGDNVPATFGNGKAPEPGDSGADRT